MDNKYQTIYNDGCNGWRMGELVWATPNNGRLRLMDEDGVYDTYFSRNGDGLFESKSGTELLVLIEK